MRRRKPPDQFLALFRECQEDLAPVIGSHFPHDGLAQNELIDNADRAVVPNLQLLCQIADRQSPLLGGRLNGKERLILVRS